MSHEVITLQLGSFANYVGAHYWNFQDELLGLQEQADGRGAASQIDSDVLFRRGETLAGEGTYTPRLVLWDLRGALGGASAGGALYRDQSQPEGSVVSTWSGGQEVRRAAPVPRSRFAQELESEADAPWPEGEEAAAAAEEAGGAALSAAAAQLDEQEGVEASTAGGVRYWTDYLKAHLHPRSVQQLGGAWHGLTPFGSWGDGGEHWRSEDQREEAMERVRFFAEECDHLQGFQCLVDDLSGFGCLAAQVLQEVRDEYGAGAPVMLYALRPGAAAAAAAAGAAGEAPAADDVAELRRRRLNAGLSLATLAPLCSTFTPVAPPVQARGVLPLLRWQAGNPYHASALCAAALDTASLPYRLAESGGPSAALGRMGMWDLSQLLTAQHRSPLTALSLSMPCPALPADAQQAAQRADSRFQHGGSGAAGPPTSQGSGASSRGGGGGGDGGGEATQAQPFTTHWLASLTPGVTAAGNSHCYAESVVLRGPRSAGAALGLGAANEALDAALAAERLRCVRHRTLTAQPLPVPLPFPHIFAKGLSLSGDAPAGASRASLASGGTRDIACCAVLTRHSGTAAFALAVAAVQREFGSAAGSAQGQAMLENWGYGREEVGGLQERLARLAHAYEEEEC